MPESPVTYSAGSGGSLFTLTDIDVSGLVTTVTSNAPIIIGAGIAVLLVKKAVPMVPAMIAKIIK